MKMAKKEMDVDRWGRGIKNPKPSEGAYSPTQTGADVLDDANRPTDKETSKSPNWKSFHYPAKGK